MISNGAYSKKYQAVEKEKNMELRYRERKLGKERAYFLSVQTSQRQKAMEEKKRAMMAAEEQRRRKALDDRRKSQQQATDRFRSAISRMKGSKTSGRNFGVLDNLPYTVKSTTPRCFHPHPVHVLPVEQGIHASYRDQTHVSEDTERLVMAKDVEITPVEKATGLRRKTPSLDDVLNQLKGNECESADLNSHNSTSHINETAAVVENVIKRRSASDSCLDESMTASSHSDAQSHTDKSMEHNTKSNIEESENRLFHPANRSSTTVSKDSQVVVTTYSPRDSRPETPVTTNNNYSGLIQEGLSNLSSSPTVPDSLNSSFAEPVASNTKLKRKGFEESVAPVIQSLEEKCFEMKCSEQPSYACVEDSDISAIDSLEESSPRMPPSKFKYLPGATVKEASSDNKQKVVGILKKGHRSFSVPFTNRYASSRVSSMNRNTSYSGNTSTDTIDQSQMDILKSQKKVRFSDQIEVNERESSPAVMNIADSVQIELWKNVFPKEFPPQHFSNSAFTPKMKCSLSNSATPQVIPRTLKRSPNVNGISVRIPAATAEDSSKSRNSNGNETIEVQDLNDNSEGVLKSLDKTPTDAEINSVWDQIRQCLQDGRKVPIPPRVYNFKPPTENGMRTLTNSFTTVNPVADSSSKLVPNSKPYSSAQSVRMKPTARKQLVYRQPNQSRLVRTQNDVPPRAVITQYTPVRQESTLRSRFHPSMQSSSKEPAISANNYQASLSTLSLEEQHLMQSIERINQRLKDHMVGPDSPDFGSTEGYYPVPPSTAAPKRQNLTQTHPLIYNNIARPRVLSETSKSRTLLFHKQPSHTS